MRRPLILVAVAAVLVAMGAVAWQAFLRPGETVVLRVAAGERSGDAFRLMSEIGEVLARHSDTVRLKLYKGNVMVTGRKSPKSLYSDKLVTFEDDQGAYDQKDAAGFIKLNALRLRTLAARKRQG